MIGLFKQKSPANIVLLFLFGLLIKLPLFLYPKKPVASINDGKLYNWLAGVINTSNAPAFFASLLAFVLLYVQALMVNYLVNEYRMTTRQTFLPGMAYLLITSLLPEWSYLSSALVSNTIILLMLIQVFRLYNVAKANSIIFNIGLLAAVTSFFFFPALLMLLLCVLLGLMILRPFRLNEVFLFIMGVAAPYYFYAAYLFLTDQLSIANLFPHISLQVPQLKRSLWLVGSTILLLIPFLIGGFYIQNNLRKMLIQARKNWSIVLLYLLLAFLVPFINSTENFHTWVLTAVPFAAFHASAYLYAAKKWLPVVLFFLFVAFIVSQQYVTNTWQ